MKIPETVLTDKLTRILEMDFAIMEKQHYIGINIGSDIEYYMPCTINVGRDGPVLSLTALTPMRLHDTKQVEYFTYDYIY